MPGIELRGSHALVTGREAPLFRSPPRTHGRKGKVRKKARGVGKSASERKGKGKVGDKPRQAKKTKM